MSKAQAHWILAKMGKRVLRPGGKELTHKMLSELKISNNDDVVEFAPGIGYTAELTLGKHPHSYLGIDADEEVITNLSQKLGSDSVHFKLGNAGGTQIADGSKDKVYGEAILTMHANHRKSEIIREAYRILKKGGQYAIHELGLVDVDTELKDKIQKDLAVDLKVNARPLTEDEWRALLEKEGFVVKKVIKNGMKLLEPGRVIDDEGIFRSLKIGFNILRNTPARKRISEIRRVFKKHQAHMNAVAFITEKI